MLQAPSHSSMSAGLPELVDKGRKISPQDIQVVQNLIEKCLQLYMPQHEVVATLQEQAKVESSFTLLVWQKLEEQNPDFFRAYYTRLKVKDQIVLFNHLLDQQMQLFSKLQRSWLQALPSMMAARAGMALPPRMPPMPHPGMSLPISQGGHPMATLPPFMGGMPPNFLQPPPLAPPTHRDVKPTQQQQQQPQHQQQPQQQDYLKAEPPMAVATPSQPPQPLRSLSLPPVQGTMPARQVALPPVVRSSGVELGLDCTSVASAATMSNLSLLQAATHVSPTHAASPPIHALDVEHLPKTISFSDLGPLDLPTHLGGDSLGLHAGNLSLGALGMGDLPRNFSLSDMTPLDLDALDRN